VGTATTRTYDFIATTHADALDWVNAFKTTTKMRKRQFREKQVQWSVCVVMVATFVSVVVNVCLFACDGC
jgi:hypothetical protein